MEALYNMDSVKERQECEVYSRIVGYIRPVDSWNEGKQAEFKDRLTYNTKTMSDELQGVVDAEVVEEVVAEESVVTPESIDEAVSEELEAEAEAGAAAEEVEVAEEAA